MMPTAWEETNGTGITSTLVTVGGVGGATNLQWTADSGMLPDGVSLSVAHAPTATGGMVNDKSSGGAGDNISGAGWDIVLQHSAAADGLNVFAGYSTIEQNQTASVIDGDRKQWSIGATYAIGGFTVGYQLQEDDRAKAAASATSSYENEAYGISFAVNDDLSISYGRHQSEAQKVGIANVELDGSSFQIAYSMGGASIKIADSSVDNNGYATGTANQKDGTTVSLALAF
jgi:outer membrane protein OmpU